MILSEAQSTRGVETGQFISKQKNHLGDLPLQVWTGPKGRGTGPKGRGTGPKGSSRLGKLDSLLPRLNWHQFLILPIYPPGDVPRFPG